MNIESNNTNQLILSLEGGGVKGLIELKILEKIEEITGKSICKLFDHITGTSVGGLIAVLLTLPKEAGSADPLFSVKEALDLFKATVHQVFPEYSWRKVMTCCGMLDNEYDSEPLANILKEYCKQYTLEDALIPITIPYHNNQDKKACYFSTLSANENNKNNFLLKDVTLGEIAAQGYFPPVKIQNSDKTQSLTIADGGICANNPSKVVVDDVGVENIGLLWYINLEEENTSTKETVSCFSNGKIRQIKKVIDTVMYNDDRDVEHCVRLLLKGRYITSKVVIPKKHARLDNSSTKNLKALEEISDKYIKTSEFKACMTKLIKSYNEKYDVSADQIQYEKYHEFFGNIDFNNEVSNVTLRGEYSDAVENSAFVVV